MFKKTNDKVTLTFKDAVARDRAKELINNSKQQSIFEAITVPQKTYPAIARLNGLNDIQNIVLEADKHEERRLRCAAIMKAIASENPLLQSDLVSVRILSNRASTCSFHVRLGFASRGPCDMLIERGRVVVNSRAHAVVAADPAKEVKHCARCQKFGHLAFFCKAAEAVCARCAGPHSVKVCKASANSVKYANCSNNHASGSRVCAEFGKAVLQYISFISS